LEHTELGRVYGTLEDEERWYIPGILYECQKNGVTEFDACKCMKTKGSETRSTNGAWKSKSENCRAVQVVIQEMG
jgi:hypothetical protein